MNDAHDYLATKRAMDIVGIGEQEQVIPYSRCSYSFVLCQPSAKCLLFPFPLSSFQDAIFRVVAAILHLGNVDFAKGEESDSSFIKDEESKFHLHMTAELLMCDWSFAFITLYFS